MVDKSDLPAMQEIHKLLYSFFGDHDKVNQWMNIKNPMLGNLTPNWLIEIGRADKILFFVKHQLEKNKCPNQ